MDKATLNSLHDSYIKPGESSSGVKSLPEQEDAKFSARKKECVDPQESGKPELNPT